MVEVVAIIPARGGSVGIPRKNLKRVGGVPLVARAISAARTCPQIDRVVVSTDDAEITAVSREWGAEVVERPDALSGGDATSESAVTHALGVLSAQGVTARVIVFLQATSPFLDAGALSAAITRVASGDLDVAFSAVETYEFLWSVDGTGMARGVNHDPAVRPRRQDRAAHLRETGGFYVLDAEGFRRSGHRFFGRIGAIVVPEATSIEIDDDEQLRIAQALASSLDEPHPIDVDAVVTDFDGVHTDDTVTLDGDGVERVRVSRADGMGVDLLRRADIRVLILSRETDGVVAARARKLRCDVLHGIEDKATALREWAAAYGIPLHRIAYVGNDLNDLGCLEIVGWPVAVPDAHALVRAAARTVLRTAGGRGAVREVAERVLAARRDVVDHATSTRKGRAR